MIVKGTCRIYAIDLGIKHFETNMNGNGYSLVLLLITGLKDLFKRSSQWDAKAATLRQQ